jgi:hypothetical protein
VTDAADWLLSFRSVQRELRNPSMGSRETRGGWLVREAALEAMTLSICETALELLVERGVLVPVRYAPVAGPLCAPDPGRGCAAVWPPLPREEPNGWQGRRSPAWAWVYRVPRGHGCTSIVRRAPTWAERARALPLAPDVSRLEVYDGNAWVPYSWPLARRLYLGQELPIREQELGRGE